MSLSLFHSLVPLILETGGQFHDDCHEFLYFLLMKAQDTGCVPAVVSVSYNLEEQT